LILHRCSEQAPARRLDHRTADFYICKQIQVGNSIRPRIPNEKAGHKDRLFHWYARTDSTYLRHLHSAGPTSTCLKHSFKSVEYPCDELQAHLTRNFAFENKFSRESFLATCFRACFTPTLGINGSSHSEHTTQKPHRSGVYAWYSIVYEVRTVILSC
jgi:hypothetical protein